MYDVYFDCLINSRKEHLTFLYMNFWATGCKTVRPKL